MILLGGILLLFDTHVHLNDEAFDDDIEEVIKTRAGKRCDSYGRGGL